MRFRTEIVNVALLHKIVRSLSALAKVCVIRLSLDKVHFIVPRDIGKDGVEVWSQVKVGTLFDDYKIESNNNNEIWLELVTDALLKVLRSADTTVGGPNDGPRRNATDPYQVILKLNKKGNQPIWAFDIRGKPSAALEQMSITHEINVRVLSQKRQADLNEPLCPPPDIHLVLPNLSELRNIISRLGHMADDVKVSANHEGSMVLSVRSDKVDLSTKWTKLNIPQTNNAEGNEEEPPPPNKYFSTTVSIRGLQKFLTSHLVSGTAIACICENHCVIAYVYIELIIGEIHEAGGVLTFFVPAKNIHGSP